jgi:hypothetical protein
MNTNSKPLNIVFLLIGVALLFTGAVLFIAGLSSLNFIAAIIGGIFLGAGTSFSLQGIKGLRGKTVTKEAGK